MIARNQYWIRYGLSGGFGGCDYCEWEAVEAKSYEDASTMAYEAACQEYEVRDIGQIMEEDECDEDEAQVTFEQERESWLDYEVSSVEPEND